MQLIGRKTIYKKMKDLQNLVYSNQPAPAFNRSATFPEIETLKPKP